MFLSIGRVDLETCISSPDHVRVDFGGIVSYLLRDTVDRVGGHVEVRYGRRRALRLTVWTQAAHDICHALMEARNQLADERWERVYGAAQAPEDLE